MSKSGKVALGLLCLAAIATASDAAGKTRSNRLASLACFFIGVVDAVSASGYGGATSDAVQIHLHGLDSDGRLDHTFVVTAINAGYAATAAKVGLALMSYRDQTQVKITYYPNAVENPDIVHVMEAWPNSNDPKPQPCGPG